MEFTYRPIAVWPGRQTARRLRSKFKASYTATLGLLDRELRHLGARNIVLQVALDESDIRLDGRPRAGSQPRHPGIILAFDSKHGPLSYPCDCYNRWEDNLRAIALSLEALRSVDRYGVTRQAEQYRGWQQLPGPLVTADEAALIISRAAGTGVSVDTLLRSAEALRMAHHAAALRTHPNRGGTAEDFRRVQQAKEVLEEHLQ
jgi:hypothetical protein